ncbi:GNAT family N-acetyltransferase [Motilimonas sp. KMU-193]|uniref:GNAT family N-acetyltransferase n=1 Tax=Motilimonas sp. KMU-193 TaxID=3388668 RepID=UPI00396B3EB8
MATTLPTARLLLRQWQAADYEPFAQMSADPQVMRYFPECLSQAQSNALADKAKGLIEQNGWGFWALELKQSGEFIGFVGLHQQTEGIPNTPFIEVGWRIARAHWRQGYASEAARAAIRFAFEQLGQSRIYAFTALSNQPSQQVMQKLGMVNTGQDFLHPKLTPDHPLAPHCLFAIDKEAWSNQ